jgi:dynein heavy chain
VIEEFLPTPTKCHYTFNLRDLSKVVQGMLMSDIDEIVDKDYLVKLYMCETYRVFRDRLIDEKDRKKFSTDSHEILEDQMSLDWELSYFEDVIFGDFESGEGKYTMLSGMTELLPRLNDLLTYYNMQNTPMDLVFFADCIQHLARIARILRQQRGNAMLVGVGGSGRRSMAMFGASFNKMTTFQIEITKTYSEKDWFENIRTLLKMCALEDQTVQFLFSDTQIVFESFLEDINNLLNSGEIPNLFLAEEKQMINEELADKAKAAGIAQTREAIYAYFVQLCRERLHIVLAFSPVGDSFRNRCRQFPSIINCATIDWYNSWPEDALYSVAHRKFEEKADDLEIRADLDVLSKASVQLHMST